MKKSFAKRLVHQGQNIQKFRLIHHLSQADVAISLQERQGRPVSQEFVSDLENKETIEDEALLKQIAEILKVDPEVIKNLDLEAALNVIANNIHAVHLNCKGAVHSQDTYVHSSKTNNPLDTIVEMFEKQTAELKEEIERLKKRNS